jgi:hypothetical protein
VSPAHIIEGELRYVITSTAERDSGQVRMWAFWLAVGALVLAKLALVADLSVELVFTPHDDSLYVERALHLLRGEAFGPYDSRILVKLPGISVWLAAVRSIGIPYLLSIQLLYIAAGLYLCHGLVRAGSARWVVLIALALYLFNPMTMGSLWVRVLREPLSTGLFVAFIAGWLHIIVAVQRRASILGHALIAAATFALALYVREEEKLLWLLLAGFGGAAIWILWRQRELLSRFGLQSVAVAIVVPVLAALALGWSMRAFIEYNYGAPILHEFSEGEYPRLIAAIRSINTQKDNRMVMVPQEALAKVRAEVPEFGPVANRLPRPGPWTNSCRFHGVCSEWSSGWTLFLIKDAAYYAGLTPNLPAAQTYFRSVREAIEKACAERRLACHNTGHQLLPRVELRWTRAYVRELLGLLKLLLRPDVAVFGNPPGVYSVSVDLGREYQAVTMTDYFDTQWQSSALPEAHRLLRNPLAHWRTSIASAYLAISPLVLVALLAAFFYRLLSVKPVDTVTLVGSIVVGFLCLRLLALAYLSVFIGAFESRAILTTFVVALLFAVPYLAATITAIRRRVA